MKEVLHIGPATSQGGMASVINSMILNPPSGFTPNLLDTHSDNSKFMMLIKWFYSIISLSKKLYRKEVDLVHIHVTHGFSWIRKLSFMKICLLFKTPAIIHIHSGKFDVFCKSKLGIYGHSVRKNLAKKPLFPVILEERWTSLLSPWLPDNFEIIHNSSNPIDRNLNDNDSINLLSLSRNGEAKNLDFCIDIQRNLYKKGIKSKLIMTGLTEKDIIKYPNLGIEAVGWVSKEDRDELISKADILLSPSYYEGSSMSVIEALVSGLPVIASRASKETITTEEFLVSEFSSAIWAKKAVEIKNNYPEMEKLAIEMSKKYTIEESKTKWKSCYENLLNIIS